MNSSRNSRAKFSLGLSFLLFPPSSQTSMAGSAMIASRSVANPPSACVRSVSFCRSMSVTDSTFLLLVAKWPCQNRVSFSRSGSGPRRMRLSQQTLSRSRFDDVRAVWRRPSIASASSGGSGGGWNSRSTLASGPAARSRSSSARVAPKPARRCRWATLRRSQGSSGVGL